MRVEIWADVVCPWCYIGKRRFEEALELFRYRDDVEVVWRSYQLDAKAPSGGNQTTADYLAERFNISHDQALATIAKVTAVAATVGLEFHLDEAKRANTFDAHRLLHLATKEGRQGELHEALLRAHFMERKAIGDHDTLVQIAESVDIDPELARSALENNLYADEVHIEQQTAAELGVRGVPFFVVDRKYAISGAQSSDVFLDVLQQAWEESDDSSQSD